MQDYIPGSRKRAYYNAGAPTNGVVGTGTFAGDADPGDILIDNVNGNVYVNAGTLASPVWNLIPRGYFVSAATLATGSAQNVAHGLGVVPAAVMVAACDTSESVAGVFTVVEGVHTSTNLILTITSGKYFKVLAFA